MRAAAPDAVIAAWDVSPTMVEAARSRVAADGLDGVEVGCADVADLLPDKGAADAVIAINAVLSYLVTADHRRRSVRATFGLLRPGGALAAVVQQRNGRADWALWFALRGLAARTRTAHGGPGDRTNVQGDMKLLVHHYSRRELVRTFTGAGFTDLDVLSLRRWARGHGDRVPLRSPNPLMLTARRP